MRYAVWRNEKSLGRVSAEARVSQAACAGRGRGAGPYLGRQGRVSERGGDLNRNASYTETGFVVSNVTTFVVSLHGARGAQEPRRPSPPRARSTEIWQSR